MPSTILSDNGVTSGTAGIKTTGSNDGQLALQTTTAGGTATTAMTIDTSQNVGIGTSSPASKLHVAGSFRQTGATAPFEWTVNAGGYDYLKLNAVGYADNLIVANSGGNVGIGTSSPGYKLALESSSNFAIHLLKTGSNDGWIRNIGTMDIAAASGGGSGQSITFSTGANYAGLTTRAMIDGSGNVMFRNTGSTAPWDQNTAGQGAYVWLGNSTYSLGACNNNNIVAIMNRYQGSGVVIEIKNGTTVVGSISHNGTNTAYNTSSDYRLKHDIQPMTGGLSKIAQLKPVTYKWNADNSDGEGFIAHELAEVFPGAVTGEKDALKEDGSIDPQGIDTSFLVATLVTAIQELKAELDATKAQVAALQAKV